MQNDFDRYSYHFIFLLKLLMYFLGFVRIVVATTMLLNPNKRTSSNENSDRNTCKARL